MAHTCPFHCSVLIYSISLVIGLNTTLQNIHRIASRPFRTFCKLPGHRVKHISTSDNKACKVNINMPIVSCAYVAVYRETALLYAMSAAALTHVVAQACADGSMRRCKCTEEHKPEATRRIWHWGLCEDNYSYGRRFTRRFMQLRQSRADHLYSFLVRHNINIGIQVRDTLRFLLAPCCYVEETERDRETNSVPILVLPLLT